MILKKKSVVVTRLNASELRAFKKAKKYVTAYCGKVSDAEVLRFLIRSWGETGWQ